MRIQAVILKKIAVKEFDELIVCYTKESGKQVFHAKSILRPSSKQASHLDILNYTDFGLAESKQMPIVISAISLNSFAQLKSSLPSTIAGYFLLECFDKLVFEGENDPELWNFLTSRLEWLDTNAQALYSEWPKVIEKIKSDLLKTLGYSPETPARVARQWPDTLIADA